MDLTKIYLFRITHIENIPHILLNGITHKDSKKSNPNYKSIGDNSLINTRGSYSISNGKLLGEYIPFYFGSRTPMLYVIQNGYNGVKAISREKIVYCVSSVQNILDSNLSFVYTNGHATDGYTKFFFPTDISNIQNQIDFKATNAKYWKKDDDLDFKRRKEAEFLIENDLQYKFVNGFIVYSNDSKKSLLGFGVENNNIFVKSEFYF